MAATSLSSESKLEVTTVVLLGLAALITAWASFQSSLWSGVSTDRYAVADQRQVEANTLREAGLSVVQEDQLILLEYTKAARTGDANTATVIKRDVMSKRLRDAVDAWERAPIAGREPNPFNQKYGYVIPTQNDSQRRGQQAQAALAQARRASTRGDQYNLAAVLLAGALFLLGISSTLRIARFRIALMAIGGAILIGTCVWMVLLPVQNPV